jgi:phage baseplate assembly protein gpV
MAGVLRQAFQKMMQGIDGQLPAQVISYDREANRATVQPLITRLTTDGQAHDRGTISSMPVVALGGGGFYINFPLKPGDRGWIEASDRDISLFMQGDTIAQPNTVRMHNFSDGRFIPDVMGSYTFTPEDDGKIVIASLDGKVKLTLSPEELTVKGVRVFIEAEQTVAMTAPGGITLLSPVLMPAGATIGGVVFGTHIHDTPSGPSGPPKV